jgi:murein DD-endopeptidase MepM/ murein hydrolase activator NlpD
MLVVSLTGLLIVEYRFFKAQSHKMFNLRDDYRNYLVAVKKILQEYNTKNPSEVASAQDGEKKKTIELAAIKKKFPDNVRVFSTDVASQDDSFVILNREYEYLKDSFVRYLKDQQLDFLLQRINLDEWRDYNAVALTATPKSSIRKKPVRRRGRSTARRERVYQQAAREKASKRDMAFSWPIERAHFRISSVFGPRKKANGSPGFHYGLDMAAMRGTPVKAAAGGVVIEARNARGYGKTIVIAHNRKYRTRYAHLSTIYASVGQKVERGDCIGKVGATGHVRSAHGGDPSHLHFEVCSFGKHINPMYCLV